MSNLILGKDVLTDWKIYPLDIDGAVTGGWPHGNSRKSDPAPRREPTRGPTFYMGTLQPNGLAWDTFLKLNEWTKVMLTIFWDILDLADFILLFIYPTFLARNKITVFFWMFVFPSSGSGLD